ncbi:Gfo/Idh/MocA family oxidoreductase [Paenibacillus mucilaginosus]|uniref:Gfo/Idh/MocA family protein n=1 Tax=Paenibacillus mucilaginosus TaxID=61624 RepID=UPI0011D20DBC|nr:Gfo/Idh/MocA family oxidoreductase [Paenibacillus mucilaginosus]WFA17715.1 Gfo/Idh/MocA family oxidoreductase [Paenibacillus mucilaginosus]
MERGIELTYQREFKQRLSVAVIGAGNHAYRNIIPCLHHLPVRLQAICDLNEELARETAGQFGCRAYMNPADLFEQEELDAVFLCVSPKLHPYLAMEAFEAGVHVWMEKPVSMRAYEVERMIEKRSGLVSVAGFKKAFMPSTEKAIEIAHSDSYGNLQSMLAVYPMSIPDHGREVLESGQFTDWLGNGVHPLSLMLAVGGDVEAVTVHHSRSGRGVCLLDFAGGAVGNFHMASGPHPIERYSFYGNNWHLEIENSLRVTLQRGIPHEYNKTWNYVPEGTDTGAIVWEPQNHLATLENKALFTQGMYGEMKYFCDCILEGRQPQRGSLEFALKLMKVYEAALLSNGKTIAIS